MVEVVLKGDTVRIFDGNTPSDFYFEGVVESVDNVQEVYFIRTIKRVWDDQEFKVENYPDMAKSLKVKKNGVVLGDGSLSSRVTVLVPVTAMSIKKTFELLEREVAGK